MHRILASVVLLPFLAAAHGAWGQTASLNATAMEIAQLPRFCWAQFQVPNADGPEFRMSDCGPAANHYCGALIQVIRAKHTSNKSSRLDLLGHANADVSYTERGIQDYPRCSIRQDLAATKAEISSLIAIYGGKRPGAR